MSCRLKFHLNNNSLELQQNFIENSIYIRSLCVQTNICKKNYKLYDPFLWTGFACQGYLILLGCGLLSLLLSSNA